MTDGNNPMRPELGPGDIRPGVRRVFAMQLNGSPEAQSEMDEEIRLHLESRISDLRALGLSQADAESEARRRFGAVEPARTQLRASAVRRSRRFRIRATLDALWHDARYAVRGLRANPAFTIGVLLTLTLGLGVNSAVFRLVDRLFIWAPAGVRAPEGLRQMLSLRAGAGAFAERRVFSYPDFSVMRNGGPFSGLAAYVPAKPQLLDDGRAVFTSTIGQGYVEVLGLRPAAGRFFTADELQPEAHIDVVVISHAIWRAQFGRDSSVLSRSLVVAGRSFHIVGVAPEGFAGLEVDPVDLWIPLGAGTFGSAEQDGVKIPWYQAQGLFSIEIVGRIKPGMNDATAMESLEQTRRNAGMQSGDRWAVRSLVANRTSGTGAYADNVRVLKQVGTVATLILVLTSANAMNLILSRGLRRRQETAVRLALGISRARLIRQFVVEATVLALSGAVIAIVTGAWVGDALRHTLFPAARWTSTIGDTRVIVVTLVLSLVVGVCTGIFPALQVTDLDLVTTLKGGAVRSTRQPGRLRDAMVIVQVALSFCLLAGTGIFVRSLQNIAAADIGVVPDDLVTLSVPDVLRPADPAGDLALDAATPEAWFATISRIPGVRAVAPASIQPFGASQGVSLEIPGRDSLPNPGGFSPLLNGVTPQYLGVMGMHLLAGRFIADGDNVGTPRVVVLNAFMARSYWPGENPVGKCLRIGGRGRPCSEVVGIVADIRERPKGDPLLRYYVPIGQMPSAAPPGAAMVRTAPGMESHVAADLKRLGLQGHRSRDVVAVGVRLGESIRPWRIGSTLFGGLGSLALLLAGIGLCSVLLCVFGERAREIGVRMALGATSRTIAFLVIRTGARLLLIGWAIGLAIAVAGGRVLGALTFGVSPHDPFVFLASSAALATAGLLATWLPTQRARRLDPIEALRDQ